MAVFTIFGDDSYGRLSQIRSAISHQKEKNDVLRARVDELKSKVDGIQQDDRALEKAARSELGMAKPNEMIFLFDSAKEKKMEK